jgi:hypothetical protein
MNWLLSILGGLLASLIAITVWEKFKQPHLIIEIPTGNNPSIQTLPDGKTRRAFYHLLVRNTGRSPAYYCKIFLRFFDEKGEKLVIGDVVNGKWDRGPEPIIESPVPIQVHQDGSVTSQLMETRQGFLIPFAEVLDIHHNVPAEGFCPFIKYDNESECYAFSGWSYLKGQAPGHKVPEWKLDHGKYLLEVELVYAGKRSHKESFFVENETTRADGVKLQKTRGNGFVKRWTKSSPLAFIVLTAINVGVIVYFVTQFQQVALSEKAAFITQSIAGTMALMIPLFEASKIWVKIALTTAIELFIAGIFFQAINVIS